MVNCHRKNLQKKKKKEIKKPKQTNNNNNKSNNNNNHESRSDSYFWIPDFGNMDHLNL